MQYCGQEQVIDYFNFSTSAEAPVKLVVCGFTQGGGVPASVLSLFVFGAIGLALTYKTRHPAPVLVSFMLTGGVVAGTAPGEGLNILAAVFFFGLAAMGMYLYARASRTL